MKEIEIISSKSDTHRALIGRALAEITGGKVPEIIYQGDSLDIDATCDCLEIIKGKGEDRRILCCRESGSTLRFLLPIAGALGMGCEFHMEGRLPERPLLHLRDELEAHGQKISRDGEGVLICEGKLRPGEYRIPGNISSQYISGLLMALPLLEEDSRIIVEGEMESAPYVDMTLKTLREYGVEIVTEQEDSYCIRGNQIYSRRDEYRVEGDWSSSAFWLVAGTIGKEPVKVKGLKLDSAQGDREILKIIEDFRGTMEVLEGEEGMEVISFPSKLKGTRVDGRQIPDLIPIISLMAAVAEGETEIVNSARLRNKESDRIRSIAALLGNLNVEVKEKAHGLTIRGRKKELLKGGEVDSFNDHRIAMTAAIASLVTKEPVEIWGSRAIKKSYPQFYEIFRQNFGNSIITR